MTSIKLVSLAMLTLLIGSSSESLSDSLRTTAAIYLAKVSQIAPVAGHDTTFDYYQRLRDDADSLEDPSPPEGYTAVDWSATLRQTATLDLSLATQLLERSYRPMASVRGWGEILVRASSDATMQPVAVYVPSSYVPGRAAPLIVFLHGHPQSESQLISPQYIAALAEKTNSIVVAPWGRGYYDFRGSASDVYDALDAATIAFTIDPRKRYLAGYSMGGFSVFEVATVHPGEWSAVMCIAGALLGSDSRRVVALMRTTPFYVLTGRADESIPTQYPTATAAFLQASGLEVSFYSEPGGIHRLITLVPILTQAWSDMLSQIVRTPPAWAGGVTLPSTIPMSALRP
jgi:pimeloyl-ACP methyl ester carboxylesterase